MNFSDALKIQIKRGNNIESLHKAHVVVCNSQAQIVYSRGLTQQHIYPRSAVKALQALALFTTGAFQKFSITPIELALACASHSAQKEHVEAVNHWLVRMGLSSTHLECGGHWPANLEATHELIKSQQPFNSLHNNCSGKHAGFLANALALNTELKGYIKAEHPVQIEVKRLMESFCSYQILKNEIATDGCSIPTYYMPMSALALGMARFADLNHSFTELSEARKILFSAIQQNPFYMGGSDRYCTKMTTELGDEGFVKIGAEGVIMAALPKANLGVVIKTEDGATRSTELAMTWVLKELGLISESSFKKFSNLPIENWNKIVTGSISIDS